MEYKYLITFEECVKDLEECIQTHGNFDCFGLQRFVDAEEGLMTWHFCIGNSDNYIIVQMDNVEQYTQDCSWWEADWDSKFQYNETEIEITGTAFDAMGNPFRIYYKTK